MRRLIIAAVIAAIGIAAWVWWPSDARRIRRKLDAIQSAVNERPKDGIAQVGRTVQLATFVTDDVVLEPGEGRAVLQGREPLLAMAARAPNDAHPYTLSFGNVWIDVQDKGHATVHLTATFSRPDSEGGTATTDSREVKLEFRRGDDWRIARITLIDTPERAPS